VAKVTPTELWQRLKANWLHPDIETSPKQVPEFFLTNLVQRTLTLLVGKGKRAAIPIEATEAGALKVAPVGGGTAVYETLAKAVIADAFATKTFTVTCSKVDVTTWNFPVIIELSNDGTTFGADIYINANTFYSIDQSVKAVKYKNGTAGSNATLQLVGFY